MEPILRSRSIVLGDRCGDMVVDVAVSSSVDSVL